jgi:hypothetical protein
MGASNECTDGVDTIQDSGSIGTKLCHTRPIGADTVHNNHAALSCAQSAYPPRRKQKEKQTDNSDPRAPTSCVADTTHGHRWCRTSIIAVRRATWPTRRGHHHWIRDSLRDYGM